jgi:hypothetical protein
VHNKILRKTNVDTRDDAEGNAKSTGEQIKAWLRTIANKIKKSDKEETEYKKEKIK